MISIDIETYSSVDLKKCGVYKYVESLDFEILLIGYSLNGGQVHVLDMSHPLSKGLIINYLKDDNLIKTAWNANFERICLDKYFKIKTKNWDCTQFRALNLGLPLRLEKTAEALKLKERKIQTNLINWFCKPDKNGNRRLPINNTERWKEFKEYCRQDVVVEMEIKKVLPDIPIERSLFELSQKINDRGVSVDLGLVKEAIRLDEVQKEEVMEQLRQFMGIENPNSDHQFKLWMKDKWQETKSIAKDKVEELLETDLPENIRHALLLRKKIKNVSVKKYKAIQRSILKDGKVRGLFQDYGARTGRWAGRLVQVQNLYKNKAENLNEIREYTKTGKDPRKKWGDHILSELIRTAFIGNLSIADFSAIEARVLSWIAGEKWRNEVFSTHGKIYEATAAKMFNIPIAQVTKEQRNKGKTCELAFGYQGAVGAARRFGAEGGDEELVEMVRTWRELNPAICKFWYDVDAITRKVIQIGAKIKYRGLTFGRFKSWMYIKLPSGRSLYYFRPFYKDGVNYFGWNLGKWSIIESYGGKFTENIVQAIARDCLAVALMRLKHLPIVMHIHDEIVVDGDYFEEMIKAMEKPIKWAPGLVLKADGFKSKFYKKE